MEDMQLRPTTKTKTAKTEECKDLTKKQEMKTWTVPASERRLPDEGQTDELENRGSLLNTRKLGFC